jgi:hypothetical protein
LPTVLLATIGSDDHRRPRPRAHRPQVLQPPTGAQRLGWQGRGRGADRRDLGPPNARRPPGRRDLREHLSLGSGRPETVSGPNKTICSLQIRYSKDMFGPWLTSLGAGIASAGQQRPRCIHECRRWFFARAHGDRAVQQGGRECVDECVCFRDGLRLDQDQARADALAFGSKQRASVLCLSIHLPR